MSQSVLNLAGAVGGIDVDEDGADLRGGVLDNGPLGAVRGPDADPVATLHAEGEEGARALVHGVQKFAVGVAQLLVPGDEADAVRLCSGNTVKVVADRLPDQRFRGRGRDVAAAGR